MSRLVSSGRSQKKYSLQLSVIVRSDPISDSTSSFTCLALSVLLVPYPIRLTSFFVRLTVCMFVCLSVSLSSVFHGKRIWTSICIFVNSLKPSA